MAFYTLEGFKNNKFTADVLWMRIDANENKYVVAYFNHITNAEEIYTRAKEWLGEKGIAEKQINQILQNVFTVIKLTLPAELNAYLKVSPPIHLSQIQVPAECVPSYFIPSSEQVFCNITEVHRKEEEKLREELNRKTQQNQQLLNALVVYANEYQHLVNTATKAHGEIARLRTDNIRLEAKNTELTEQVNALEQEKSESKTKRVKRDDSQSDIKENQRRV